MQSKVKKQLSESEYEKFGSLFRCSNTELLSSKLTSSLDLVLSRHDINDAKKISKETSEVFSKHIDEIEIYIDFYESHEADGFKVSKETDDERMSIEKDFEYNLKAFKQIKSRCERYESDGNKIGYSIISSVDNREDYPLYPPSSFITQEDIDYLSIIFEKFLHWKVFLSSDNEEDTNIGNPYLYKNLTSKIGAGGLDINAQENNRKLMQKLLPILSKTKLSVRKLSIIIWAHQYFISQLYYKDRFQHTKNFFIPSLTSLVKDVDRSIKNKT